MVFLGKLKLHRLSRMKYYHYKFHHCPTDILLQASETINLSDEYIRAEVTTFIFEGHDTTANAMSFAIFLLARYPEVQAKTMQEMDEIFGNDTGRSYPIISHFTKKVLV